MTTFTPSLATDAATQRRWTKLLGHLFLFTLSHFWWFGMLLSYLFCTGGIGSGIECTVPVAGFVGFAEVSTFYIVPPLLPFIIYYPIFLRSVLKLSIVASVLVPITVMFALIYVVFNGR